MATDIPSGGSREAILQNEIVTYMVNRQWAVDRKSERKRYLFRLAQKSKSDPDIAAKIGGMLIYNQVIEQCLKDIVDMSIHYIKAEIWPVTVSLSVDLEKATFGKVIEYFKQFATIEDNRDTILRYLTQYNRKRNDVVHDLFDVQDLRKLARELDEYADLADEIIHLLDEYEDQVCANFRELQYWVDFTRSPK